MRDGPTAEAADRLLERKSDIHSEIQQANVTLETETFEVVEDKAPDGGWGWWVLVGRFFVALLGGGSMRSEGIYFVKLQELFGASATATAWASTAGTIRFMAGPVASLLCHRFSCRQLVMVGAALVFAGHMTSAFAPSLLVFFFGNACLNGIGRALVMTPPTILLGQYFDKKRGLAFGLAAAGVSIGGFTIVPLTEFLFQTYSFTWTFILLGGIFLNHFVCAALFRSIESHRKITQNTRRKTKVAPNGPDPWERKELLNIRGGPSEHGEISNVETRLQSAYTDQINSADISTTTEEHSKVTEDSRTPDHSAGTTENDSPGENHCQTSSVAAKENVIRTFCRKLKLVLLDLKDVRFMAFAVSIFCFGLHQWNIFIPPYFRSVGLTDYETASILSVSAICDTVSRVVSGMVLNLKIFRNHRPLFFNLFTFIDAIVTLSVPFMTSYWGLMGIGAAIGLVLGCRMAQQTVVLLDILGAKNFPNTLAIQMFMQFLAEVVGPTVSGQLIDTSQNYGSAFYFGGVAIMTGSIILLAGNLRKVYIDRAQSLSTSQSEKRTKSCNN